MQTYRISGPIERFQAALVSISIAALFLVPIMNSDEWVWIAIFGVFLIVIPAVQTVCRVNVIRINEDSTIEFKRLIGTIRLNVRDITSLVGVRTDRDYGRVEWSMQVFHHGVRTTVPYFDQAWDFIDDIVALNPSVLVSGEWPIPYPGFHSHRSP